MPESLGDIASAVSAELDRWLHGRRRHRRRIAVWTAATTLTALVVVFALRIKQVPAMLRAPSD